MGEPEAIAMKTCCSNDNNDKGFKIILCGGIGVGKTAIYTRWKDKKFDDSKSMTPTPDQCILKIVLKDNVEVKVRLCDTVGMEKFESLTHSYFTDSHLVLIVYSTDKEGSLKDAETYKNKAREHAPGACLVLVRNKIDLVDTEQVSEHDAKKKLNLNDFEFNFKTSAKTGDGIKNMVNKLGCYLDKHHKGKRKSGVVDVEASKSTRRSCCSRQ